MSSFNLDVFFRPRNVALIGASATTGSIGNALVKNLLEGKYREKLFLVNPKGGTVEGIPVYRSIPEIDGIVDLAIVAIAPPSVVETIEQLGQKGCRGAIILSINMGAGEGSLADEAAAVAARHHIRLLGPNTIGVLSPMAGLNASFSHVPGLSGDLGLISQSSAIVTSVAEWASHNNVGFSGMVALGDKADVDIADMLDYFAMDPQTRAILLYIENIRDARKFMTSARAAARAKPVILMKTGRHPQGLAAVASRKSALAGADEVYDAAFERAGLLRVFSLHAIFDAVETLTHIRTLKGHDLAIVANSNGVGVLAVDHLVESGGSLATLSDETIARLDDILPTGWSRNNPVYIVTDANTERYKAALDVVMDDKGVHAVLGMFSPSAIGSSEDAARSVAALMAERKKAGKRRVPVFAVRLGGGPDVVKLYEDADIAHFETPADAIQGLSYVLRHMKAQDQLMLMPPALGTFQPDYEAARTVIDEALVDGHDCLDAVDVSTLLKAYGLPMAASHAAASAVEAAQLAAPIIASHGAAVVKINSPDIRFKSDIGGVVLGLANSGAVATAAQQVLERAREAHPDANIKGVTVHPMIRKPHAIELLAGMMVDEVFGPVMVFGRGGTAVEVIRDKALALPPLDLLSARAMIEKTRVNRRLEGYRDTAPCDKDALAEMLVRMSQMIADFPEIQELDFNPVLADVNGNVIADARVRVAPTAEHDHPHQRFAIKPYPNEWEQERQLKDGRIAFIRPMRPEDEALFPSFFERVTDDDMRLRFFSAARSMSHAFIARLTQIDYARSMAFIALDKGSGEMLGSVRLMGDTDHEKGEYAVMVRSDLKGLGLGWILMKLILAYAEKDGFKEVEGEVLRSNQTMRQMCEALGFDTRMDPDDPDLVHMVFQVPDISDKIANLI
ncbi:bifunctional acetate--CoA ligase family protein/GNAT family N-acetyltransferase [uncultured Cohaesibacter sp.]|uniref:bifunctional acetate--CoA ligase family protein/GNAT family N-acetyltransferase n=1 Tax=uncultured Cohaesibacter sp. TaxID=1002546 RepID=UPI0029C72121|nr:bifunctional acetate--CoA ligase family protein/GNAT family N-acetyltransferase [uncultured Cohaesibacter sp.]